MVLTFFISKKLAPFKNTDINTISEDGNPEVALTLWLKCDPSRFEVSKISGEVAAQLCDSADSLSLRHLSSNITVIHMIDSSEYVLIILLLTDALLFFSCTLIPKSLAILSSVVSSPNPFLFQFVSGTVPHGSKAGSGHKQSTEATVIPSRVDFHAAVIYQQQVNQGARSHLLA
jgi:hypothetical protein